MQFNLPILTVSTDDGTTVIATNPRVVIEGSFKSLVGSSLWEQYHYTIRGPTETLAADTQATVSHLQYEITNTLDTAKKRRLNILDQKNPAPYQIPERTEWQRLLEQVRSSLSSREEYRGIDLEFEWAKEPTLNEIALQSKELYPSSEVRHAASDWTTVGQILGEPLSQAEEAAFTAKESDFRSTLDLKGARGFFAYKALTDNASRGR